MKTTVRDAVFETNSSSTHAVVVGEGDVYDRTFDENALRNGKVVLVNRASGYDEWHRYYTPENILVFLIVSEIEDSDHTEVHRNFLDELRSEILLNRYCDHDILPIVRSHFPVVDQAFAFLEEDTQLTFEFLVQPSDPLAFDTNNLAAATGYMNDHALLKRILFNSRSYVETTPENEWGVQPPQIDTDLGRPDIIEDSEEQLKNVLDDFHRFAETFGKKDLDND